MHGHCILHFLWKFKVIFVVIPKHCFFWFQFLCIFPPVYIFFSFFLINEKLDAAVIVVLMYDICKRENCSDK